MPNFFCKSVAFTHPNALKWRFLTHEIKLCGIFFVTTNMNRIFLTCLLVCSTVVALAQGSVSGKVKDKQSDEALEFVNVAVTKQGDTRLIKGGVTDVSGAFRMDGLANGQYVLTVSYVGYKTVTRPFAVTSDHRNVQINTIQLTEDSQVLKEVTVTAKKKLNGG